ncbi:MAG TPA: PilZ domain-containing protein [Spirochaetota bacterium]|nr:PilZ domain-containing protein [Spirochaetota bacterium]HNT10046.1 PilZ domain-containing protein [Spirochaetota bacterium]HNV47784.1 PilZ domain-containing protein [Spirochaetota bacterium]HOS39647.1 PilZ domain-containing protein [Spirochaetota bacterium]HPI22918.1 PilZ domain-containing protein [Spirochaetota bacterium]
MRRTRSIDKRDYGRLKTVNLKVDYRIKGSETPTTVEVINLSTGGLCFLRNTIINKGEFIQVRFPFKTRKVIMNAQVVRIDGREVGVKFTDSEKEIERFINAFNEEYPSIRTQESADGDRVFGETYQRLKGMRTEKEPKP